MYRKCGSFNISYLSPKNFNPLPNVGITQVSFIFFIGVVHGSMGAGSGHYKGEVTRQSIEIEIR
jgi:hypothetical protein